MVRLELRLAGVLSDYYFVNGGSRVLASLSFCDLKSLGEAGVD